MRRRTFLAWGSLLGASSCLKAEPLSAQQKRFADVRDTIRAVQEHMFPEGGDLPSARGMHTIAFMEDAIFHPVYDKDIRAFVIEGAEELNNREKGKFVTYNAEQKEYALRSYEATAYGSNWLSRIMVLAMEALFSDPIYGSNIQQAGWKSLKSFGGEPRPKTRYIEL